MILPKYILYFNNCYPWGLQLFLCNLKLKSISLPSSISFFLYIHTYTHTYNLIAGLFAVLVMFIIIHSWMHRIKYGRYGGDRTKQSSTWLVWQTHLFGGEHGTNNKCCTWRVGQKPQASHTFIKVNKIKLKITFAVSSIIKVIWTCCLTLFPPFTGFWFTTIFLRFY